MLLGSMQFETQLAHKVVCNRKVVVNIAPASQILRLLDFLHRHETRTLGSQAHSYVLVNSVIWKTLQA